MPDSTQDSAKPVSLNLVALESRVTGLEKALASYIAPKLGAAEHDAHAAAQSWLEKFKGFFAKPKAAEPTASSPSITGTSPPTGESPPPPA